MIRFKSVRVKNFMSVGNKWMGYDFIEGQAYLVTGKNGVGKSVILLDGLMFALFGKAFRNINLGQIPNSINTKECLAEVEFEIGTRQYKVIRGIRPGILEIYVDGNLKNKDAAKIDYQRFLETQILRMNERTFKQIVILGSKEYIPFMKLSKSDRRIVVEDLLSLTIFQQMALATRARQQQLMTESQSLATEIKFLERSIKENSGVIDTLRSSGDEYVKDKQRQIDEHREKIASIRERIIQAQDSIDETLLGENLDRALDKANDEKFKLIEMTSQVESNIARINTENNFFSKNDICPKCHQDISQEFKETIKHENDERLQDYHECLTTSKAADAEISKKISDLQARLRTVKESNEHIRSLTQQVKNEESIIAVLVGDIAAHGNRNDSDLGIYERKLADLNRELSVKRTRDLEIVVDGRRLNYIFDMVRDGGIRSKIIEQYLPLINSLIHKYLAIMESDIDFSFDRDFKETIKSRHRDSFTYASFSEGQKLRIDLCLLFTWREISRIRNSAATNLIIFDEIGDSSLDSEGFDFFMKILKEESSRQCVVIISHSPEKIANKVNRIYEYDLNRGFTTLKNLTENDKEVSLT